MYPASKTLEIFQPNQKIQATMEHLHWNSRKGRIHADINRALHSIYNAHVRLSVRVSVRLSQSFFSARNPINDINFGRIKAAHKPILTMGSGRSRRRRQETLQEHVGDSLRHNCCISHDNNHFHGPSIDNSIKWQKMFERTAKIAVLGPQST
jgi:hypothetical protein